MSIPIEATLTKEAVSQLYIMKIEAINPVITVGYERFQNKHRTVLAHQYCQEYWI